MSITYRTADPIDLPALHALFREALPGESVSEELLREKLFPPAWPPGMRGVVHVAESEGLLLGALQGVERGERGWLGLMAVDTTARRTGIAHALAERVINGFADEVTELEVLAIPGNYLYPGLDPRMTGALCFIESLGFERFKDCVNLNVHLDQDFPIEHECKRLAAEGVAIRRATADDDELLQDFFARDFGADWLFEARSALGNNPPTLHLALRNEQILGFAGHSAQNRELGFFGPMGTTPEARGLGIGRVLLWWCLRDLWGSGHRTCVIPWVGPISFYHEASKAVVERVFWRYRRDRV